MRIVVDMNLSPAWVDRLRSGGHDAVHWSSVGSPDAPDVDVMAWAAAEGRVVLTNDLDFGAILAASGDTGPSVVQVRSQRPRVSRIGDIVLAAIARAEQELREGALLTLDTSKSRLRVLPLTNRSQLDS
ncbi:DUF5615 family PIN-like protein [Salinarimonas chemoclinalis]|uniref:DUF5615 family PIN-like protein n=1 Tax=Salinarimonas chemoclinalis TaxID=3241599 RepID=UPI003557A8A7